MSRFPLFTRAAAGVVAAVLFVTGLCAQTRDTADPLLVERSGVQIRRSDFDAELMKMPADIRGGFAADKQRIGKMVQRLIVQRSLAAEADAAHLDAPEQSALRLKLERERVMAQLRIEDIEQHAEREFDTRAPQNVARARELYAADRAKYEMPEQVSASHILFDTKKHSRAEAERLANDVYAKLLGGADFDTLAKQVSEDPSVKINAGRLGFFDRKTMDPAFTSVAFALARPGDVSTPVLSSFGWHIVRLDGRRAARLQPFEEAREAIVSELRKRFVNDQREAAIAKIRDDPEMKVNVGDLDALYVPTDPEAAKRAVDALQRHDGPAATGR